MSDLQEGTQTTGERHERRLRAGRPPKRRSLNPSEEREPRTLGHHQGQGQEESTLEVSYQTGPVHDGPSRGQAKPGAPKAIARSFIKGRLRRPQRTIKEVAAPSAASRRKRRATRPHRRRQRPPRAPTTRGCAARSAATTKMHIRVVYDEEEGEGARADA